MPLSLAESTNKDKVFGELKTQYIWTVESARNNWTVDSFSFTQAPEDFYLKLKTLSKLNVEVKYEGGFKVYLQGEKEGGGWIQQRVGDLPGKPKPVGS